jgi:hypothetical protein
MAGDVQVNLSDYDLPNSGNFTTESETNVAVWGSNVVVGYNSSRQAGLLGSGHFTSLSGFGYSTDGGTTFTDGGFLLGGANVILTGDPALAFNGAGTRLYYASLGSHTGESRIFISAADAPFSPPNFGPPVSLSGVVGGPRAFQDKELIAVDTTGAPETDGRVYVAWTEFTSGNGRVLFAAAPPSLVFAPPVPLSAPNGLNQGAMPAVGPTGNVYVVWGLFTSTGTPGPQTIFIVRSTDGGRTFTAALAIANVTSTVGNIGSGGVNFRTRGFPYIAIDRTPSGSPTRGHIYVVFHAKPTSASRSEIFFVKSTDEAATWSAPIDITSGAAVTQGRDTTERDNWMPSIAVSPATGHISVKFYSRREDPANTKIRVYEAGSTDGGTTWFNKPSSDVAFTATTGYDPLIVPSYFGDYIHVVSDGAYFHSAWGDARNKCEPPSGATAPCSPSGRGDQDVFYRKDPDTTVVAGGGTSQPPIKVGQARSQPKMDTSTGTAVTLTTRAVPGLVVRAIAESLRQRQLPVEQVDEERGLVSSGSISLSAAQVREHITPQAAVALTPEQDGRYFVSFKVERAEQGARVDVSVRIIVEGGDLDSPIGGKVVPSNGTLERQQIDAVTQAVQRLQ